LLFARNETGREGIHEESKSCETFTAYMADERTLVINSFSPRLIIPALIGITSPALFQTLETRSGEKQDAMPEKNSKKRR